MAWVFLEGIDRVGKTTVAEQYKNMGYEVIHMSAPNKKYVNPGYTGPSYLDECLDLYIKLDGKDVIFDRTVYGEKIWPQIYSREPQLQEEDFEVLKDYEDRNGSKYILMHDPDVKAHWQRCVEFKENLNQSQFTLARKLFYKMAEENGFEQKTLANFTNIPARSVTNNQQDTKLISDTKSNIESQKNDNDASIQSRNDKTESSNMGTNDRLSPVSKLDRANAINSILSKKILKKDGGIYDELEEEVRQFLLTKLDSIFGKTANVNFSNEEVTILKAYVARIKVKMKE
jgi:hypothetical protein